MLSALHFDNAAFRRQLINGLVSLINILLSLFTQTPLTINFFPPDFILKKYFLPTA